MSRKHSYMLVGILLATGLLMAGCETMDMETSPAASSTPAQTPMTAAERMPAPQPSGGIQSMPASSPGSPVSPAAGTADDSLQACMARIPSDSTASQRMLAERTCQRDEAARNPFASGSGR